MTAANPYDFEARWGHRSESTLSFDPDILSRMLLPILGELAPSCDVDRMHGGHAKVSYHVTAPDGRMLVLRIHTRDPAAQPAEIAAMRHVSGHVPVPEVLFSTDDVTLAGCPYSVMT